MKRKERHLTVTGWVVVGLLDTLAGVISGGLMALWQLPSTYRWRGYWAIGGEWILIVGAIIIASRLIDGTGESVLSYIKDHTPQIKNWEVAGELSKGNKDYNSTGKNIGLLYTKDPDKMSHEVPMAFLQHAPQDRNLEIVINCEGRDAGMMIPYPLSACLVYGL